MNTTATERVIDGHMQSILEVYSRDEIIASLNRVAPAPPVRVKQFIRAGEIDSDTPDTEDMLMQAGHLLDRACSYDICGEVLFVGEDDRVYTLNVEAAVGEATDEYARQTIEDLAGLGEFDDLEEDERARLEPALVRLGVKLPEPEGA